MADFIGPPPSVVALEMPISAIDEAMRGAKETAVCKKCKKLYDLSANDHGYCKKCIKTVFASGPFSG